VAVIPFNAWEYQASEKLWAGLVQKIFATIEQHLGLYGRFTISARRNLLREATRLRSQLLPYTLIAGTTLVILAAGLLALGLDKLALLVPVLGIPGLIKLGSEMLGILRTPQSERIVSVFQRPDYSQHLGFMAEVRQDLEALINGLPRDLKVAVFVDDLDRCEPEKAVEVLEAIKLLLDFDRFIVFLAIDARIITHAIEEHYGDTFAHAGVTGYEYLHKIVQVPFNIPEPSPADLVVYLNSLLGAPKEDEGEVLEFQIVPASETAAAVTPDEKPDHAAATEPGVAAEDQDEAEPPVVEPPPIVPEAERAVSPEWVVRRDVAFVQAERIAFRTFILYMLPNPRRIKRLVNVYRLVRDLAPARGVEGLERRLGKLIPWLILSEQWPYTTHLVLECLDRDRDGKHADLQALYRAAQALPESPRLAALSRLDEDPERLAALLSDHGRRLTRQDLLDLRGLTIHFNPALRADIEEAAS